MIIALVIFLITYALMLSFQQYRPWIALTSAAIFYHPGLLRAVFADTADSPGRS